MDFKRAERGGAVAGAASLPELPPVMRQLYVDNVVRIKRNVLVAANLADNVTFNDGDILNPSSIAKRDRDNLIAHAGLALRPKEITPGFWKCLHGAKKPAVT